MALVQKIKQCQKQTIFNNVSTPIQQLLHQVQKHLSQKLLFITWKRHRLLIFSLCNQRTCWYYVTTIKVLNVIKYQIVDSKLSNLRFLNVLNFLPVGLLNAWFDSTSYLVNRNDVSHSEASVYNHNCIETVGNPGKSTYHLYWPPIT